MELEGGVSKFNIARDDIEIVFVAYVDTYKIFILLSTEWKN